MLSVFCREVDGASVPDLDKFAFLARSTDRVSWLLSAKACGACVSRDSPRVFSSSTTTDLLPVEGAVAIWEDGFAEDEDVEVPATDESADVLELDLSGLGCFMAK